MVDLLDHAERRALVLRGHCAVGVCGNSGPPAAQELKARHLRDEEILLVLPSDEVLETGGGVTPAVLRGRRFVVPQPPRRSAPSSNGSPPRSGT